MSQPASLQDLLRRIQAGDEAALLDLHARYINLVYSVAYHVMEEPEAAAAVAQETFMHLWEQAVSYDQKGGAFVPWLLTTTRKLALDARRKRPPAQAIHFINEESELWDALPPDRSRDLRRRLMTALADLPPEQQDIIGLAYFYGMSQADIAAYRQIPLDTVKRHIRQGMEKLRSIYPADRPAHPTQDTNA